MICSIFVFVTILHIAQKPFATRRRLVWQRVLPDSLRWSLHDKFSVTIAEIEGEETCARARLNSAVVNRTRTRTPSSVEFILSGFSSKKISIRVSRPFRVFQKLSVFFEMVPLCKKKKETRIPWFSLKLLRSFTCCRFCLFNAP